MSPSIANATPSSWTGGRSKLGWSRLIPGSGVAAMAAVGASAAIYLIASAAGLVDRGVLLPSLAGMGPLRLASVSVTAAAATIGAAILFAVLLATTRRPIRNFRVAATTLAVLSLSMPATIQGPPRAMRLAMAAMHVATWAVSVFLLPKLSQPVEHDLNQE